jgi:hypothetical protein
MNRSFSEAKKPLSSWAGAVEPAAPVLASIRTAERSNPISDTRDWTACSASARLSNKAVMVRLAMIRSPF